MVCPYCNQEMQTAATCKPFKVQINGTAFERIPYGQGLCVPEDELPETCHDCGVKKGGYHHPGCDMEQCPCCGDPQIIFCDCDIDDKATRLMAEGL